jgi:two-component system, NarL family, invasion response regulator UvrY
MKVLIADDHSVVREGLKQIVIKLDGITQVQEAKDGLEALEKIKKEDYDLVIMDISMPGMSGLDVLQNLKNANIKPRILMLSVHSEEQYAIRAFKLGASGYLSKDSAYEELANAIRKIAGGGKFISLSFAEKMIFDKNDDFDESPHQKLSEREFQVMRMLALGKSVTEVAKELFLSDKTVSTYRSRILEKMNMNKNAELTLYAIKNDLIE